MARVGDRRGAYRALVGETREGDHLEDRQRWESNIKMDLQEVRRGHELD